MGSLYCYKGETDSVLPPIQELLAYKNTRHTCGLTPQEAEAEASHGVYARSSSFAELFVSRATAALDCPSSFSGIPVHRSLTYY